MRKISLLVILALMTVMLPPSAVADETKDIPTNASETGIHDSLVAALAHAGLVTALEGDGPFTVFAPTDDAFTAAGIDLSTFDTDEENATLVDILTYHVVVGETLS
ncbi:MAG: fasciclin domain-containing protein, partial [Candidatus Poseidoniales archaeon]